MKSLTSSPTWQDYLWQKWLHMMLLKRSREKEKTLQREIGLPLILRIKLMEGTGIHTMTEITQWINRNLSLTLVTNRTMPHVRDNKIALSTGLPKKTYCRNKYGTFILHDTVLPLIFSWKIPINKNSTTTIL